MLLRKKPRDDERAFRSSCLRWIRKNCKIEGFSIGGKTATSEKLPRGNGKYISSFLGFAKAKNPTIIGIVLIDEPYGTYYGGTIDIPVMKSVFKVALPYMGIYKEYTPDKKEP